MEPEFNVLPLTMSLYRVKSAHDRSVHCGLTSLTNSRQIRKKHETLHSAGTIQRYRYGGAHAASISVPISLVSMVNAPVLIGEVTIRETQAGLLLTPKLKNLPPGPHGFHVHETGSCEPGRRIKSAAMAAGGHLNPRQTMTHSGPDGAGHLGDLPALIVSPKGTASYSMLAPHLKRLSDVKGHALIIHAGKDNYSGAPVKFGGGGERIACGVI
jgi:Cu-Zn family superoxide dismutase